MSAKKKINFMTTPEVSYKCDIVSICIYCWDEEIQDIAIVLQDKGEYVILPSKSASESGYGKCSTESNFRPKHLKITPNKIAYKDKEDSSDLTVDSLSWGNLNNEIFTEVFGEETVTSCGIPRLLYLLRTYSPFTEKFSCHAIFGIQIGVPDINKIHKVKDYIVLGRPEITTPGYKLQRRKLHWVLEELYKNVSSNENIRSAVPTTSKWETKSIANEINSNMNEHFYPGAIVEEVNPQIIFDKNKTHQIISPVALFDSPGFTYLDRLRLYEAFVHLSFPFSTVDFKSIKPLLTELGFSGREEKIFRAMDETLSGELDIYQFMLGLTAMDQLTEHGNGPAEFRCRQIFRFYDEDKDGFLSEKELEEMIIDIAGLQSQNLTPEQIQTNVRNAFKVFDVPPSEKIPIPKFLISVGNLRFRGTSLLYRAANSVPLVLKKFRDIWPETSQEKNNERIKKAKESTQSPSIIPAAAAKANEAIYFPSIIPAAGANAASFNMHFNQLAPVNDVMHQEDDCWQSSFGYILAQHTVSVRRSGLISNVSNLLDMERAGEVCNTGLETLYESEERLSPASNFVPQTMRKHRVQKQVSAQAFNIRSLPNELLSALRYFEGRVKDKKPLSWGQIDKIRLAKYIITICESLKEVMDKENRLLHISSPCYILGDLHGNFHDLICFEKALWRLGPHLTPANFLFLGDYVDRGEFGIEVVAYLFAQKLKAPNRFHLLRGNHEVREIQQAFHFHNECINKFGPHMGRTVWEEINQVFDRMPLAAIVDKKIFCIHGGVPSLDSSLNAINAIPCPLPCPDSQSPLAWQLMWNDPVAPDDLTDEIIKELDKNQGFAHNLKRQTALVFNATAFEKFLERHKLSHVIRAHEVKQNGFEIQQSGRLFTVFSSSQYCGTNNEAACILVHDLRIRIIRIDTTYKPDH